MGNTLSREKMDDCVLSCVCVSCSQHTRWRHTQSQIKVVGDEGLEVQEVQECITG